MDIYGLISDNVDGQNNETHIQTQMWLSLIDKNYTFG